MKLALALAALAGLVAAPLSNDDAASMLEKAESKAAAGKYKDAQRLYRKLAKEHAGTPEGEVGERRGRSSAFLGWADIVRHGDSNNRVDVVVMGEGYQIDELKAFDKLAEDLPDYFRRNRALGEYYTYFNFLRADLVSADNGVDGFGREYDTALGGHVIGTYAGHVAVNRSEVREMLGEVPGHDGQAIVFAKLGVLGTGGGGVATIGGRNMRTAIHEFGHSFGRLSDEYSTETHKRGPVKANVNVTDTEDPEEAPWKHWIDAKVPGVGMYQGAAGQARGAWRPTANGCVMASGEFFCPVCREQLVKLIYRRVDPIDDRSPEPHERSSSEELVLGEEPLEFVVQAMRPAKHQLEAVWWVVPEDEMPPAKIGATRAGPYDRRRRVNGRDPGKLRPIEAKPAKESRGRKDGRHVLTLKRKGLDPGRYRVICRVTDRTMMRGAKHPWVLKDERGLLQSEVAWWVRVGDD
ncbi:MAG: M64 family metallopeptidase [Planctomycetota bacterium]